MGLILSTAKIPGMGKGEQGVKNQFKGLNLINSPEPLKQLSIYLSIFSDDIIASMYSHGLTHI